jgi:hypothetical protein
MKLTSALTTLTALLFGAFTTQAAPDGTRPNVILIMADDMGYEALSSNGSESCKSPNLDKLAAKGVRFTNCFSNPICTPSRAKIMTGHYNVRNYVKFGWLDRGQTTFAHQLKAAGYATAIAGKWQLGKDKDSPQHFGFEQSCLWQHTRSGRSNDGDKRIDRRFVNPLLEINGKEKDYTNGEYGPQICTDFICDFIDTNKKKPFLVYYPMILTHCPFDPTPDSTDWDPKRLGSTTYKGDRERPSAPLRRHGCITPTRPSGRSSHSSRSPACATTRLLIFHWVTMAPTQPIVTPWNGTKVVGGKGTMTRHRHARAARRQLAGVASTSPGASWTISSSSPTCSPPSAKSPAPNCRRTIPPTAPASFPCLKNKAETRTKEMDLHLVPGASPGSQQTILPRCQDRTAPEANLTRYKGSFRWQATKG